jgi:hypothetical protein
MYRWYPAVVKDLLIRREQRSLRVQSWQSFPADPVKSVAVVGNAGYLSEIDQGLLIDSHDLVIRMNNFRISGFEAQVGHRTDLFFTNFFTDICYDRPMLREADFIVASVPNNFRKFRRQGIHHRHAEHIAAGLRALRRTDVFVPEWEPFCNWVRQRGCVPSTGLMAIKFALGVLNCQKLYLTGFSFFQGQPHYFNDRPASARNHNFAHEQHYLHTLLTPHVASGRVVVDSHMQGSLQIPRRNRSSCG